MSHVIGYLLSHGGVILFFLVLLEQGGVPLPAAPFLLAAGALAAGGRLNLFAAIGWATSGSLLADTFWFYAGHQSKARLFQLFPRWHAIQYAVSQKKQPGLILRGLQVLTAAKFLPLGILVPLRAGAFEIAPSRFLLVDGFCSLFYASIYVLPGFFFHGQLEQMATMARRFGILVFAVFLLAVAGYFSAQILKRVRFREGHAHKIIR